MGRKIFVSYKFADDNVANLSIWKNSTVRDYVTEFENILDLSDNIYKGESDGEDLSKLSEFTIWQKLRDRIYDSSITVIFISPGMKECGKKDKDQWIPWEVSYSLKETSRKNKNGLSITSRSNAMLAVVLPDASGSYAYYLEQKYCCDSGCIMHHSERLFQIIRDNMFNLKTVTKESCNTGRKIWRGEHSYIAAVKWSDFIQNYGTYLDAAYDRRDSIDNYEIVKTIS